MAELPASVRLALWTTAAWRGRATLEDARRLAMPDVDHVGGALDRLGLWRELGEQALFVALPRPGDLTRMPRAGAEAVERATASGECVYVPGIGGLLVPTITEFGTATDTGLRIDWAAYDAEPVARHRLEMLDLREVEAGLASAVADHSERLAQVGGQPWGSAHREAAEAVAERGLWGLPDGLPARAVRVIALAATVSGLADVAGARTGLAPGAVDGATAAARADLLRSLVAVADSALTDATNVAVMTLAGWRPA